MANFIRLIDTLLLQQGSSPEVPRLRIADRYPNAQLVNQLGTTLRFRDDFIDVGKSLVINSMYTTCRGSCPRTSSTIRLLRQDLYPIFRDRLIFLSFSVEPEVDTVEKLADYGKLNGASIGQAGLCDWHLVTGTSDDIEQLRRALGFFNLNPKIDKDVTQHSSSLLVGNPEKDRWTSHAAELPTRILVDAIRRTVGSTFKERYGIEG